jgi:threonine/homoserine/homoserine lactone efflux protein
MRSMLFIRGFVLGLSIAAPVGPIGALCIRRSVKDGWPSGFISGLGAATADMLYGSVAAFGLKTVSDIMIRGQSWLRGFGGVFLIYLGMQTLISKQDPQAAQTPRLKILGNYGSTFILTLTNPLTILTFVAVFSSIMPSNAGVTTLNAIFMVVGVFLGSSTWWLILSLSAESLSIRFGERFKKWIKWISGAVITIFGLGALITLLQ